MLCVGLYLPVVIGSPDYLPDSLELISVTGQVDQRVSFMQGTPPMSHNLILCPSIKVKDRNAIATQAAQQGRPRIRVRGDWARQPQVRVNTTRARVIMLFRHVDTLQVCDAVDKVQPRLEFSLKAFSRSHSCRQSEAGLDFCSFGHFGFR